MLSVLRGSEKARNPSSSSCCCVVWVTYVYESRSHCTATAIKHSDVEVHIQCRVLECLSSPVPSRSDQGFLNHWNLVLRCRTNNCIRKLLSRLMLSFILNGTTSSCYTSCSAESSSVPLDESESAVLTGDFIWSRSLCNNDQAVKTWTSAR